MTKTEGVRNPVSELEGKLALKLAQQLLLEVDKIDKDSLKTAVKYTLQQLHKIAPGKSVELRVPPIAAISIIEGKNHKRGTPPAAIEVDPIIWLKLALGNLTWEQSINQGLVFASGANADLSPYLPISQNLLDE